MNLSSEPIGTGCSDHRAPSYSKSSGVWLHLYCVYSDGVATYTTPCSPARRIYSLKHASSAPKARDIGSSSAGVPEVALYVPQHAGRIDVPLRGSCLHPVRPCLTAIHRRHLRQLLSAPFLCPTGIACRESPSTCLPRTRTRFGLCSFPTTVNSWHRPRGTSLQSSGTFKTGYFALDTI
jgi:hypothetical protein